MGNKRKPAYILANRDHMMAMDYANRQEYSDNLLVPLHAKCSKLTKELIAHLTRMRVKHDANSDGISVFPDADGWELRNMRVSFTPMFFNWPEVPNGRLRLSFFKAQESASPTWFRVRKVSPLEPKYGFDTLALAKELQALRKEFISKRKAKNIDADNRMKSRRLANQVNTADLPDNIIASTSGTCTDPARFELKVYYTVTPEEAEAILSPLRESV